MKYLASFMLFFAVLGCTPPELPKEDAPSNYNDLNTPGKEKVDTFAKKVYQRQTIVENVATKLYIGSGILAVIAVLLFIIKIKLVPAIPWKTFYYLFSAAGLLTASGVYLDLIISLFWYCLVFVLLATLAIVSYKLGDLSDDAPTSV